MVKFGPKLKVPLLDWAVRPMSKKVDWLFVDGQELSHRACRKVNQD